VASGLSGLECQAHGGAASNSRVRQSNPVEKSKKHEEMIQSAHFLSNFKISQEFEPLSPTGC
jgi:hypothetical protein